MRVLIKMCKSTMTILVILYFVTVFNVEKTGAVVISPCKVQNMVTQPKYGTSLKTKNLVSIVQVPPVFVQNVMVGICESHSQNFSTGMMPGEFYSCQQRYSAVEVYIAEVSHPGHSQQNPYQPNSNPGSFNEINYIRESVIIESGCDFTFNLLPLIMNAKRTLDQPNPTPPPPPQQTTYLRSPFHPNLPFNRQPPPPPSSQTLTHQGPPTGQGPPNPNQAHPIPYPGLTQGRSGLDSDSDVKDEDQSESKPVEDDTNQTGSQNPVQFTIFK